MKPLIAQYQNICTRIQENALRAKRTPDNVQLIAVSKTFPSADIRTLYQVGQRDFGENYIQEWTQKVQDLADCSDLVWHMIGHVQSNKSRPVAENAHWLHTLDRFKLAQRLNEQRPSHLPALNVLIEINIANNPAKHGIAPSEMMDLAKQILPLKNLNLRGLMCVAENTDNADILRQQFTQMQQLLQALQSIAPNADTLSMGMSQDMEMAIECGATMVRIGSAIFGQRDYSSAN